MSCPPPPVLSKDEQYSKAGDIAKSMGVQSCETDQASATFKAEIGNFLAKAKMTGTYNQTSTVGCEPLSIAVTQVEQATQTLNCTLKKSSSTVSKTLTAGNTITFDAGRDINIETKELVLKQTLNVDFVDLTSLSAETKNEIATTVKQTIDNVANTILEQKTELGATPQGAKEVKEKLLEIKDINANYLVNDVLNNMQLKIDANNDILFKAGRDLNIKTDSIKIDQDMLLKIVSQTIISDSLSTAFESFTELVDKNDETRKQIYDAKGVGDLVRANEGKMSVGEIIAVVGVFILLIVLAYFGYKAFVKYSEGKASDAAGSSSAESSLAESSEGAPVGFAFAKPQMKFGKNKQVYGFRFY
jgi:hypothetical protein